MTIKYAIQEAVPGALVWLDQDERDKTVAGMEEGVARSQFFVLYLTEGVFSRYFCRLEIEVVSRNNTCLNLLAASHQPRCCVVVRHS